MAYLLGSQTNDGLVGSCVPASNVVVNTLNSWACGIGAKEYWGFESLIIFTYINLIIYVYM